MTSVWQQVACFLWLMRGAQHSTGSISAKVIPTPAASRAVAKQRRWKWIQIVRAKSVRFCAVMVRCGHRANDFSNSTPYERRARPSQSFYGSGGDGGTGRRAGPHKAALVMVDGL